MASRARLDSFDLREAIARPEFTPRASDLGGLLAIAARGEDEARADVIRALTRLGDPVYPALDAALADADPPAQVALARVVAGLDPTRATPMLLPLVEASAPRVRRAAFHALGRIGDGACAAPLLARLDLEDPPELRALVEALGKVGDAAALAALESLRTDDAEVERRRIRAVLLLKREHGRDEARVAIQRKLPRPRAVQLVVRRGLEALTLAEVGRLELGVDARVEAPGLVTLRTGAPLDALFACRTFLELALPLGTVRARDEDELAEALADAVERERPLLDALTEGTPRIRVELLDMGKRRGLAWKVADAFDARGLRNDTRDATYSLRVTPLDLGFALALVPRAFDDPRFAYRRGDVPAASHPTLAAAIAVVAEPSVDDVVWDPFAGSGTELVECALRGRPKHLLGTDLDPRALEVSRENLVAAGVVADLAVANATTHRPAELPTLVVSNPPMGRRVHRGDVSGLLAATLHNVREAAAPGARLVWLSPVPRQTTPVAEALGFRLERAFSVDLGGFDARLERWRLPG